ncbi:hypothetical protein ACFQ61_24940 [Streptomyces sp. NPDC056500]|uniref:hypothetical protein n=1 Tax=Streptomyces sp. NPDC056500 TaxID=3345840 RepID=UPI0036A93066
MRRIRVQAARDSPDAGDDPGDRPAKWCAALTPERPSTGFWRPGEGRSEGLRA